MMMILILILMMISILLGGRAHLQARLAELVATEGATDVAAALTVCTGGRIGDHELLGMRVKVGVGRWAVGIGGDKWRLGIVVQVIKMGVGRVVKGKLMIRRRRRLRWRWLVVEFEGWRLLLHQIMRWLSEQVVLGGGLHIIMTSSIVCIVGVGTI